MKPMTLMVMLLGGLMLGGCARHYVMPVYGPTNPTLRQKERAPVRRFASVIELLPEKELEYRKLHADVWPEVIAALKRANIRNYSIYVTELRGHKYLFSYFEYTGKDPEADFAKIAADPTVKDKWWPLTDPCQRRLPGTPPGQQWKPIEMLMLIE